MNINFIICEHIPVRTAQELSLLIYTLKILKFKPLQIKKTSIMAYQTHVRKARELSLLIYTLKILKIKSLHIKKCSNLGLSKPRTDSSRAVPSHLHPKNIKIQTITNKKTLQSWLIKPKKKHFFIRYYNEIY